ncbi:hypothetical protein [Streptomyces sp. NBC_01538]|uniref:hypothetical protein n=1 Tax=Streptomyces sp. NBC_01538 TaxID=2903897 RepID=UPI0038688BD5
MNSRRYLGQAAMEAAVLPSRAAYLIAVGSEAGFRIAVMQAILWNQFCQLHCWTRRTAAPGQHLNCVRMSRTVRTVGRTHMLLRPGMACDQAIKLLERMTQQGLTSVQNAVPHVTGPGLTQGCLNNLAQARRRYDEWTLEAGSELLEVFADRSVAGRLRSDRYDAIMHRQFNEDPPS